MTGVRRYLNCGTVLAALGFILFAFFAVLLIQLLCTGDAGPGSRWIRYPG